MITVPLDGDWQLTYFPEGEYAIEHPEDLRTVHGHTIPAPFYGDNVRRLRAFEPCERFNAPRRRS